MTRSDRYRPSTLFGHDGRQRERRLLYGWSNSAPGQDAEQATFHHAVGRHVAGTSGGQQQSEPAHAGLPRATELLEQGPDVLQAAPTGEAGVVQGQREPRPPGRGGKVDERSLHRGNRKTVDPDAMDRCQVT